MDETLWIGVAAAVSVVLLFTFLCRRKSGENGKEPPPLAVGYNPLIGHLGLMYDEQVNAPKLQMTPYSRPFRETKQPIFDLLLGPAFLGLRLTIINDSSLTEKLLQISECDEHPSLLAAVQCAIGKQCLLAMNGEPWRQHRELLQPIFHRIELVDAALASVCRHTQTALDELEADVKANGGRFTPDLFAWLTDMMIDQNAEALFGYKFNGTDSVERRARFRHSFETIMECIGEMFLTASVSLWQLLRWNKNKQLLKAREILRNEVFLPIIQKRRQEIEAGKKVPCDLLSLFVAKEECKMGKDGAILTEQAIIDELTGLYTGGFDMTVATVCWTLYYLGE